MSRLANRVGRLEGSHGEGVVVCIAVPFNWPEHRQNAAAAATAQEHGVDRPDRITLLPCLASGCEDVRLLFIGTQAEAEASWRRVLKHIGRHGSMKPRSDDGS